MAAGARDIFFLNQHFRYYSQGLRPKSQTNRVFVNSSLSSPYKGLNPLLQGISLKFPDFRVTYRIGWWAARVIDDLYMLSGHGGTRTHTVLDQRILSPQRIPFRHMPKYIAEDSPCYTTQAQSCYINRVPFYFLKRLELGTSLLNGQRWSRTTRAKGMRFTVAPATTYGISALNNTCDWT